MRPFRYSTAMSLNGHIASRHFSLDLEKCPPYPGAIVLLIRGVVRQ